MPLIAQFKAKLGWVASRVIPFPTPKTVSGNGCSGRMGSVAQDLGITKVLLVTDEMLTQLGLIDECVQSLKDSNIEVVLFNKVLPDPIIDTAREGLDLYLQQGCNGIIAFGGGSPMDCAKMIGVMATKPLTDPKNLMGTLPIFLNPFAQKLPPLIAVPTTAGTGSEATVAAVITFPLEEKKYTIIDPAVCPDVAVLDPTLLLKLPPPITAATGMDALTHAVESYIGGYRTDFTAEYSLKAVKAIFEHLETCYNHGDDLVARQELLEASFNAGVAFTRANVGYVHAIAHQLGAIYHVPHGVANAMILPYILDYFLDTCVESFADLAVAAGLREGGEAKATLAKKFVNAVKQMGINLKIPTFVKGFEASRINEVAQRALNEAHGSAYSPLSQPFQYAMDIGYPVPKYMDIAQCEKILTQLVDPSMPIASKL